MASIGEWFGRRPRSQAGTSRLVLESLETRQMLAADAFVLVELDAAPNALEQHIAAAHAAVNCESAASDRVARPNAAGAAFDQDRFIDLQVVVDGIGELLEFDDPEPADLTSGDSPWFP